MSESKQVIVFGDSYSVSSNANEDGSDLGPTWVGFLSFFNAPQTLEGRGVDPQRVKSHAFPGATAEDDLQSQLARFLVGQGSPKNADFMSPSDPASTLYVLFIGINDVGLMPDEDDLEEMIENTVMDAVHTLYVKASARKFLLIDLPPVGRSPGVLNTDSDSTLTDLVGGWNEHLHSHCKAFFKSTPQASISVFSAHSAHSDILDNPEEYDFTEEDATEANSNIWSDELHLTVEVHKVLAKQITNSFLVSDVRENTPIPEGDGDSGSTKRKYRPDEDLEVNHLDLGLLENSNML